MSPAMKFRSDLNFGAEFDSRRSEIEVFKDSGSGQFVVTVFPKLDSDAPDYKAYNAACLAKAKGMWIEKYGQAMPLHVEGRWSETWYADAIPYVGTVELNKEETEFLKNANRFGDFTLDMLWLIVEGLGWRPGKPVSEEDRGWLAIWAEEEECVGYYAIVRAALAMPEPTYIGNKPVMAVSVRSVFQA